MATPKQILANRRNSQKSTGPRSVQGKAISSQNRLVHGLLGRFQVFEAESQQQYDAFLDTLIEEQKPVGLLETELVKKMSEHLWLSKRARRHQEACFQPLGPTANGKTEIGILSDLERFTGYQAHHDRAFRRALIDLQTLRKQRQCTEIGFEREKRAQAEEARRAAREKRRQNEEFRRQQSHKVAYATREIVFQLKQRQLSVAVAANERQFQLPEGLETRKIAA